jgi:hypothetical protein
MATRYIDSAADLTGVRAEISALPGVCGICFNKDTGLVVLIDEDGNEIIIGAGGVPSGIGLADGQFIVGDSGGAGAAVTPTGDVTFTNLGVFAIGAGKVTAAMLAAGQNSVALVTLSAADIIALHSAPKTLIAAPGSGKAIVVESIDFSMTYNSVQFTGGGVLQAQYNGQTTNILNSTVLDTSIKAASSFAVSIGRASTASGVVLITNKAVELVAAVADFAAGNSTAKVTVNYRIITL